MSEIIAALLPFWELIVGGLGILAALFFRQRAKAATDRARDAESRARTHEVMRGHEQEASQMDDVSLADRISRKP